MNLIIANYNRVENICRYLVKQAHNEDRATTVGEAIEATTCYLIACERLRLHHHLDDAPNTLLTSYPMEDDERDAMQEAWEAVWDVIHKDGGDAGDARYTAAWDVWGAINVSGMGDDPNATTFQPFED